MANLSQLKILEATDGFLCVDKPAGIPFSSVVKAVKRKFNLVKLGHGGSLEAMASGLLVLLVNDASRYSADIMGADRAWTGTMRLGVATDTHDIHGRVLSETTVSQLPSPERLDEAAREFRGDIFQTESRFSSIRKEMSASYEIADTGEHKPFLSHVYRFEPAADETPGAPARVRFSLEGTKGVIVRTLADGFGKALGCGAALETLTRTRVGRFDLESAIPFDRLMQTDLNSLPSLVMPLSAMRA